LRAFEKKGSINVRQDTLRMIEGDRTGLVTWLYEKSGQVGRKCFRNAGKVMKWCCGCLVFLGILVLLWFGIWGRLRGGRIKGGRDMTGEREEDQNEKNNQDASEDGLEEGKGVLGNILPDVLVKELGKGGEDWDDGPDVKDSCVVQ
jgi:hypothetical protein